MIFNGHSLSPLTILLSCLTQGVVEFALKCENAPSDPNLVLLEVKEEVSPVLSLDLSIVPGALYY